MNYNMLIGIRHLYALLLLALFPPILAGQTLNWKRADSSWSVNYYDVACADSANCAAIGRFAGYRNEVKISDDGGRTWRLVNIDSSGRRILNDFEYQQYLGVARPSPNAIFCCTLFGTVMCSTDRGNQWRNIQVDSDSSALLQILMKDEFSGIVTSSRGYSYYTMDGWTTSTRIALPTEVDSLFIADMSSRGKDGVALLLVDYPRTIVATTFNWGESWSLSDGPLYMGSISFVDRLSGWCAGKTPASGGIFQKDVVFRTGDGGFTWEEQLNEEISPAYGLQRIRFYDHEYGIAVGNSGKILRTTNGGLLWQLEETGLNQRDIPHVNAVTFAGRDRAVAVTRSGIILVRDDNVSSIAENSSQEQPGQWLTLWQSSDQLIAKFHSENGGIYQFTISDILGNQVWMLRDSCYDRCVKVVSVPLGGLSPGNYLATIYCSGFAQSVRLQIAR